MNKIDLLKRLDDINVRSIDTHLPEEFLSFTSLEDLVDSQVRVEIKNFFLDTLISLFSGKILSLISNSKTNKFSGISELYDEWISHRFPKIFDDFYPKVKAVFDKFYFNNGKESDLRIEKALIQDELEDLIDEMFILQERPKFEFSLS